MGRRVVYKPLGRLLIEKGVITSAQLEQALKAKEGSNKLTGEILIELGFAKEEDILWAVMSQYEVPYIPLDGFAFDFELFILFPLIEMEKQLFVPIHKQKNVISIATPNPFSEQLRQFVVKETSLYPTMFICKLSEVQQALAYYKEAYGLA